MNKLSIFLGSVTFSLVSFGALHGARADLGACGDIDVEANAECKVEVEGGCTAHCEPVRFEAACAAELYVDCDGMCTASAEVDCVADCSTDCVADCEVDPGNIDCSADCEASVKADCSAHCKSDAHKSECEASCKSTASAKCTASCTGTPPSATCEARCEASCSGRCEAEVNVDCQVDCQSSGYVDCKTSLEGGCMTECESPEGALFCDGDYVDHGGNLEECIDALKAELDITVDASATGSASCDNGECNAEGDAKASANCAVAPYGSNQAAMPIFTGLALVGFAAWRRRRR